MSDVAEPDFMPFEFVALDTFSVSFLCLPTARKGKEVTEKRYVSLAEIESVGALPDYSDINGAILKTECQVFMRSGDRFTVVMPQDTLLVLMAGKYRQLLTAQQNAIQQQIVRRQLASGL